MLSLGVTETTPASDAAIPKEIYGSGLTPLIISNKDMKTVKSLEESGILTGSDNKTLEHEIKEQKCSFLSLLLGTLGASL